MVHGDGDDKYGDDDEDLLPPLHGGVEQIISSLVAGGTRPMVDLMAVAAKGYYVQGSGGSTSIKRMLLPTMRFSPRLKELYSAADYSSGNFKNQRWWNEKQGQHDQGDAHCGAVVDPYKLLAHVQRLEQQQRQVGADNNLMAVTDGGAAIAAYHILQCGELGEDERRLIRDSLLKYCELDTLAMVMIVQAWQGALDR